MAIIQQPQTTTRICNCCQEKDKILDFKERLNQNFFIY